MTALPEVVGSVRVGGAPVRGGRWPDGPLFAGSVLAPLRGPRSIISRLQHAFDWVMAFWQEGQHPVRTGMASGPPRQPMNGEWS